jgi:hypothetical protein
MDQPDPSTITRMLTELCDHTETLERELAACVPGMKMIAKMLSDERALADRLAGCVERLAWLDGHNVPNEAEEALAAWDASRNPAPATISNRLDEWKHGIYDTPAEIDAHLDELLAKSAKTWKPLEGDEE